MPKINSVKAREILDSRGLPTISVSVGLEKGIFAQASSASGILPTEHEFKELRDGDYHRYLGQGVLKAVSKINEVIAPALIGRQVDEQEALDKLLVELDGTADRSNLGANSLVAVSMAISRAAALASKKELYTYLAETFNFQEPALPVPIFNLFNGGKHADTNLDFQEFLIIPKKQGAAEMIRTGAEVFHELAKVLRESGYDTDTGTEGGYAPDMDSSIDALEMIMAASLRAGYKPGRDLKLGIDVGSSILYDSKSQKYIFPLDQAYFHKADLIGLYREWLNKYPIAYLEDGLAEDEWGAWRELTAELGGQIMIVGDDLFSTSEARLRQGLAEKAANAIVIKPSQAGTVTEVVKCLKLAQRHNYQIILSQRGGETIDDYIVDLAVACGADYLKAGSLTRGERVAKYNRLLEISALIKK